MRKILNSLKLILIAAVFVIVGTMGYFAYSETSTVGFSDDGKMDLEINGQCSTAQTFQLINVAPGDNGRGSNGLVNAGNLAGELSICFCELVNTPGTSGEYADGSGDLGAKAEIAVYVDVDVSGNWNSDDTGLKSDGTTYSYPVALDYDCIDSYGGISWNSIKIIDISDTDDFVLLWRVPVSVGNEIQGDSIKLGISFNLE